MVQFNLLPEIKIQYLKAKRQKHLFVLVATAIVVASLVILILLTSFVFFVQKKSISDLSKDIDSKGSELQSTEDLNKILTVQNQLQVITGLHDKKAVAPRLFGYVSQFTPSAASIARLNVDFAGGLITISGSADSLETVNKFADTLKFTTYNTTSNQDKKNAFSEVVLTSFGRDSKAASYTITTKFDPVIFSEENDVVLTVPNIVTTRSEVAQPSALFQKTEGTQ